MSLVRASSNKRFSASVSSDAAAVSASMRALTPLMKGDFGHSSHGKIYPCDDGFSVCRNCCCCIGPDESRLCGLFNLGESCIPKILRYILELPFGCRITNGSFRHDRVVAYEFRYNYFWRFGFRNFEAAGLLTRLTHTRIFPQCGELSAAGLWSRLIELVLVSIHVDGVVTLCSVSECSIASRASTLSRRRRVANTHLLHTDRKRFRIRD